MAKKYTYYSLSNWRKIKTKNAQENLTTSEDSEWGTGTANHGTNEKGLNQVNG
jgi:hypothetical protein